MNGINGLLLILVIALIVSGLTQPVILSQEGDCAFCYEGWRYSGHVDCDEDCGDCDNGSNDGTTDVYYCGLTGWYVSFCRTTPGYIIGNCPYQVSIALNDHPGKVFIGLDDPRFKKLDRELRRAKKKWLRKKL